GPTTRRLFVPGVWNSCCVFRGFHKKLLWAVGIPAGSCRGVWVLGWGPTLFGFFCRSSEMLLASLVAITRNGCARSAFQPHLAGVFAFWVRTKTCPQYLRVVLNSALVFRGYHKKWLCAIGIPAASGRGVRFLGADQNLSAFSAGRLKCCSRLSWLSQEMAVRDRHSSRIWPGCSLSGCGPKPVRFLPSGGILSVHELIPRSE